ncbi:MAG: hypothetical protein Q9159_006733 [Coniocarpon cinnabarinum]
MAANDGSNGHDEDGSEDVLADDPLHFEPQERVSPSVSFVPSSSLRPNDAPKAPEAANISRRRRRTLYQDGDNIDSSSSINLDDSARGLSSGVETKDHAAADWYTEGPGRRVGYEDLTAIDWIYEYAKERQRLSVLRSATSGFLGYIQQFLDASQIWLVLVCTGLSTGVVAALIDIASDWLGDLKTGVVFAVCASFLVRSFALDAKQSGIPEVKIVLGGFVMRRFLSAWVLVTKSVGLCLSVASGLWLGKEGPLVHVACCCSNLFLRFFPSLNDNEARKREVFSAAAASGISVAFGAPVGGVLFSLEQLSYYFPDKTMWQSFVCAMIAAVTLQAFNPFRTGKLVLYQVTYSTGWYAFELVPFALLGLVGGLYGAAFIRLNVRVATWRRQSRLLSNGLIEVALVAVITAAINYPNAFMRAQFPELVATLFSECSDLQDEQLGLCGAGSTPTVLANLLSAASLGFVLASITFGLQLPAGVMLPSIAIGALYGRAAGMVMRNWHQYHPNAILFSSCEPDVACVTAGQYAVVGAASALAGSTRMTVSVVVIMFELTGALTYVLPIMISVLIAKWTGDAFGMKGIYESWISLNGYPFLDNRDDNLRTSGLAPDVPISRLMIRVGNLVVLPATGHILASLSHLLAHYTYRGFPVVADEASQLLLGYISRTELSYALTSSRARGLSDQAEAFFSHQPHADPNTTLDLRPWMDQTPITLSSRASLQLTYNLFLKLGLRYLIFADNGRLKGVMTKKDAWHILDGGVDGDVVEDKGPRAMQEPAGDGDDERSGLLDHDVQDEPDAVRLSAEENERRMLAGELYHAFTPRLTQERYRCRRALEKFNSLKDPSRRETVAAWRELTKDERPLPPQLADPQADEDQFHATDAWVENRVHCDYGFNIHIAPGAYCNMDCTYTMPIRIGARTLIGPSCHFYSGTHPLDPAIRNGIQGPESGAPIAIGEDCWICGNVTDVPPFTLVAGNPARVIRKIESEWDPESAAYKKKTGEPVMGPEDAMAKVAEKEEV